MAEEKDIKSVLEQIQKLLNFEGRTQAEIETATALANKLLLKYNLSIADVEGHIRKDRGKIVQDDFGLDDYQAKTDGSWVMSLVNVIARHNMCQAIHYPDHYQRYGQGFMRLVGMNHNIEIATYMILALITKIESMYKIAWKEYQANDGCEKRNTYRRGYCLGFVRGLNEKLYAENVKSVKENSNMGIVLYDNKKLIHEYIDQNLGGTVKGNPNAAVSKRSYDGTQAGLRDGRNVQLNRGVGSSSPKGHIQ